MIHFEAIEYDVVSQNEDEQPSVVASVGGILGEFDDFARIIPERDGITGGSAPAEIVSMGVSARSTVGMYTPWRTSTFRNNPGEVDNRKAFG